MSRSQSANNGWMSSVRSPLQFLTYILALGSTLAGVADAAAIPASDIAQRDANAAPVIAREARAQPWKRFIDVNERDAAVEVREAEADVKLGPIRVKRGEDFSSGLGG